MRDLDEVFAGLAKSTFRQRFRLAPREREYFRTKGLHSILSHARGSIAQRLAPAEPVTCCRTCLSKWHGIDPGRQLTDQELDHIVAAIERWLLAQHPEA